MKKIEALIRPSKLEDVKKALEEAGVKGMTVTNAMGSGRQRGYVDAPPGNAERPVKLTPKIKIEIAASDFTAQKILDTIEKAAFTGKIGDGKIFILELLEATRIRTGERGEEAL